MVTTLGNTLQKKEKYVLSKPIMVLPYTQDGLNMILQTLNSCKLATGIC